MDQFDIVLISRNRHDGVYGTEHYYDKIRGLHISYSKFIWYYTIAMYNFEFSQPICDVLDKLRSIIIKKDHFTRFSPFINAERVKMQSVLGKLIPYDLLNIIEKYYWGIHVPSSKDFLTDTLLHKVFGEYFNVDKMQLQDRNFVHMQTGISGTVHHYCGIIFRGCEIKASYINATTQYWMVSKKDELITLDDGLNRRPLVSNLTINTLNDIIGITPTPLTGWDKCRDDVDKTLTKILDKKHSEMNYSC